MQFKIFTLTALLAASTSVFADTMSGDQVIKALDSATNQTGDLISKLQNTEDLTTITQALLSNEKNIDDLGLGDLNSTVTDIALGSAGQEELCLAILQFIQIEKNLIQLGAKTVFPAILLLPEPTRAALQSLGGTVDSIASSALGLVLPDCADQIKTELQNILEIVFKTGSGSS